jgi:hypothetical protein
MMNRTYLSFFESICERVNNLSGLADDNLPCFRNLTDDVVCKCINDILKRELKLDSMLTLSFEDIDLRLCKKSFSSINKKYSDTMVCYFMHILEYM